MFIRLKSHGMDFTGHIQKCPPEDGDGFVGFVPTCPGCITQGETLTEVVDNLKDALNTWLDTYFAKNFPEGG